MAVDVDRHCYHGVFTYNIFLFLAFSLPCGKFSGLICFICGFAPQSAALVMLGSFLLLWDLSPTWSFVSRVQYELVNVEEIGGEGLHTNLCLYFASNVDIEVI